MKALGYGRLCYTKSRSGKHLGSPRKPELTPSQRTRNERIRNDERTRSNRGMAFSGSQETCAATMPMMWKTNSGETKRAGYEQPPMLQFLMHADGDEILECLEWAKLAYMPRYVRLFQFAMERDCSDLRDLDTQETLRNLIRALA